MEAPLLLNISIPQIDLKIGLIGVIIIINSQAPPASYSNIFMTIDFCNNLLPYGLLPSVNDFGHQSSIVVSDNVGEMP